MAKTSINMNISKDNLKEFKVYQFGGTNAQLKIRDIEDSIIIIYAEIDQLLDMANEIIAKFGEKQDGLLTSTNQNLENYLKVSKDIMAALESAMGGE